MSEPTDLSSQSNDATGSEQSWDGAATQGQGKNDEALARRHAVRAPVSGRALLDQASNAHGHEGARGSRFDAPATAEDNAWLGPAASVLDQLPQAIFCLGLKARVLWMNAAARNLLASNRGLRLWDGRLIGESRALQKRLSMLADLSEADLETPEVREGVVLALELADGSSLALLARLVDGGAAAKPASDVRLSVIVTDPESRTAVSPSVLMQLYGLTPAEARVAAAVATGCRLKDFAAMNNVSIDTARSQLKRVLAKTGALSQLDLVRLVAAGPAKLV